MSTLPPPSDVPQLVMKVGTLSGLDVLKVGVIEPEATVELENGDIGMVLELKPRKLTWRGVQPGSALVQLNGNRTSSWVPQNDIATVLRQASRTPSSP
jgi:hypothetical protein